MSRWEGTPLRTKLLLFVGGLVFLGVGAYLGLTFYAVKLIHPQIRKALGPEITLSDIKLRMTHLSIKEIQYEAQRLKKRIFQIEEVKVYPSLLSLLKGDLRIKQIVLFKPSFFFSRPQEGGGWISLAGRGEREGEKDDFREERKSKSLLLKIDQVRVLSGSIDFEDRKIGDPPAQLGLRELDVKIEGAEFPFNSTPYPFKVSGKMKGNGKEGSIEMEGWLNPKTIEFESFLTVRGIGVKALQPYYRKKVSAEVEDGQVHIEMKILKRERLIEIQGNMDLVGLQIKGDRGKVFWIPADLFSSQLKKRGGRLKILLHLKGDLDDPNFNLQESLLVHLGLSLAESVGMPVKIF